MKTIDRAKAEAVSRKVGRYVLVEYHGSASEREPVVELWRS